MAGDVGDGGVFEWVGEWVEGGVDGGEFGRYGEEDVDRLGLGDVVVGEGGGGGRVRGGRGVVRGGGLRRKGRKVGERERRVISFVG